jgi:enoyl-CoA hydratase
MSALNLPDPTRVTVERYGHVLVITMVRESKRNAIDRAMADALDTALSQLDGDAELRVGILAGGQRAFCAGSDLTSNGDYVTERGGEYGIIRRRRRKPLLAVVEGAALGGGLEIVLACDLIVAAHDATFGLPEVCRGLIPTCGALFRGPSIMPANLARELALTGQPISAARAYAAGLVNRITEPGMALEEALALAALISANSPHAVQACTQAMNDVLGAHDDRGWALTTAASDEITKSDDFAEGISAFLEKRQPAWRTA